MSLHRAEHGCSFINQGLTPSLSRAIARAKRCTARPLCEVEVVDIKLVVPLPAEGLVERLRVHIRLGGGERHPELAIAPRAIGGSLEQRSPNATATGTRWDVE